MRKGLPYEMILLGYKLIQQYIVTYPILAIPKPEQLNMSTKEQPHENFSYSTKLTSKKLIWIDAQRKPDVYACLKQWSTSRLYTYKFSLLSHHFISSREKQDGISCIMLPDFYLQPGPMNHHTKQIFSFVDMLTNIVV